MFKEILLQWQAHRALTSPPSEAIVLWREQNRSVWIANAWGPAVPYGPVDHGDGHQNHGYKRVKGNPEAVRQIPETQGWPEFQEFLIAVNGAETPIESVGCEKGFFPAKGTGDAVVELGSYVDVLFTELALNERPENLLLLASLLLQAVKGCESWWGAVEIALQPFKGIYGATGAQWGLLLRVTNGGRNEDEARRFWGETLKRIGKAVSQLPSDFRFRETSTENGWHGE